VLRDRLFEMADRGFQKTGINPYVLTVGKSINQTWIEKAKRSSLSHACVSLENPLNPDPGAPRPEYILQKIKSLQSEEFPLHLGLTVVRNQDFANLFDICKYVYDQIGILPNLAEINYDQFKVPTDEEIKAFEVNLYKIFKKWLGKEPINIFPYISPEVYADHGGMPSYLIELDIHDPYRISKGIDYELVIDKMFNGHKDRNYPVSNCPKTECPWHTNCNRVKWHWLADYPGHEVTKEMRFNSYCRLKKAFMTSYFMAQLDLGGCIVGQPKVGHHKLNVT